MTSAEMKSILHCACSQLRFEMDRNIIPGSLQKYRAIDRIKHLAKINRDERFYELLIDARHDVVALMPSQASRFKRLREKILLILQEAEERMKDRLKISDVTSAIVHVGV